jgi:arylsulfatase A-like enzyme
VIVSGSAAARGTIEPPPHIVDIAPTVLYHLGIPIEARWRLDGKAIGLKPAATLKAARVSRRFTMRSGRGGRLP